MLTPQTFSGFAGGITDFITGSSPDQFISGDNLLVTKDGELFSRPGSNLLAMELWGGYRTACELSTPNVPVRSCGMG